MPIVAYKSSAGSGKTYTLVKEFLLLALQSEYPDYYKRILAITFTNKAAAEMKHRVFLYLQELAKEKWSEKISGLGGDICKLVKQPEHVIKERSKAVYQHMLHHYSDISISTIDRFTHKIVRTFAHDLAIPQNFEVELDSDYLLQGAVNTLISESGDNSKLSEVLEDFTKNQTDDERSWNIELELYEFAKHLHSEESIKAIELLKKYTLEDFNEVRKKINAKIFAFENTIVLWGKEALDLFSQNHLGTDQIAFGKGGVLSFFKKALESDFKEFKFEGSNASKTVASGKWHSAKATTAEIALIESLKPTLEELYFKIYNKIVAELDVYIRNSAISKNIFKVALLTEIDKRLQEIKKEHNLLHISEFNKKIYDIISNEPAPFIYERLGERYKHYLIDEFQDTSILQWYNILPLIDNSLGEDNFNMLVGDSKQAIYRWRGGEVEQFDALPELLHHKEDPLIIERENALKRNYLKKELTTNYRSAAEIIQFNNDFFSVLKNSLGAELQKIYSGHEQQFRPEQKGGSVTIDIIAETEESSEKAKLYFEKILNQINFYISKGYHYKDMCVLFRSNREASAVAAFLESNQIPILSSESLLLNNYSEVRFVISFMRLLVNNEDAIAYSDVCSFLYRSNLVTDIYQKHNNALSEDNHSIHKLFDLLKEKNILVNTEHLLSVSIYECAERIIKVFGLNSPPKTHLLFFLDAILKYQAEEIFGSIIGFLNWWEDAKKRLSSVVTEDNNAVRIMTIHKSKGLEFEIVILPYADWKLSNRPAQKWVYGEDLENLNLETALIAADKTLLNSKWASIYTVEHNKIAIDNLNLLYVALTRPRKHLNVLLSFNESESNASNWIIHFLKQKNFNPEAGKTYELFPYTEVSENKKPSEINKEAILSISEITSDLWQEKIQISRTAALTSINTKAEFGNLIHEILAKINTKGDLEKVIESLNHEGRINNQNIQEIKEYLLKIIESPKLAPLFNFSGIIKNEVEIISPLLGILRPDRIMISEDELIILDYKTGKAKPQHIQQINEYMNGLSFVIVPKRSAYLYYTENDELIKVL